MKPAIRHDALSVTSQANAQRTSVVRSLAFGRGAARRRPAARTRLSLRTTLVFFACLLGTTWIVLVLAAAWRSAGLREAYLPDLEAAAKSSPNDGTLLAVLGGRLAQAKAYGPAAGTLQRAIASGAGDETVWLTWAAAEAAGGERATAEAVLRLGLRDAPEVRGPLGAALERFEAAASNPASAAAAATPEQLAQAICPQGTQLILERHVPQNLFSPVRAWLGRRTPEQSGFATREHWAREEPRNLRAQTLWAAALARNGRLPEAETVARRALALDPNSPEAHLVLGDVLFKGGVVGKAGLEYKAALQGRPDWLPALIGLGNVAVEKKLIDLGISTFEKAAKQAPENPDVQVGLGRAYYNQKFRFDKSLAAFDKAARLAPKRTDYFPYYSDALRASYRPDRAEAVLRRRVQDAPTDARSRYLLACLLLDNQPGSARVNEAEQQLRESLRLQPDVPAGQVRLGQLLLEQGRPEAAVALFRAALEGDPYNVQAMTALARAYRRVGQSAQAEAARQRGVALARYAQQVQQLEDREHRDPLDVAVHEQLARLFESGGELEKAQRQREMGYMLRNHAKQARRGLSALNSAMGLSVSGDAKTPAPQPAAPPPAR